MSDNLCVACGVTIPEGLQVCPNCIAGYKYDEKRNKAEDKVVMKWERLSNGDYQAKGKNGDFLLWKYGKQWKGRYRSASGQYTFFLFDKDLKKLKARCENNHYWEGV